MPQATTTVAHPAITLLRITTAAPATTVPTVVSDLTITPTHTTATTTAVPRITDTLAIITTPVTITPPPAIVAHTMPRVTTLARAITTVAYPATTLL